MGPNAAEFAQTSITDGADNSPQTLSLTATARTQVTLSAISLTFGSRTVGMKSPAKNIVFSNLHRSLTITDITFAEAIPAISPQTNACDSSVASKARCIISVTFTPQAAGARSAMMNINDSANTSPQTVSRHGTGRQSNFS